MLPPTGTGSKPTPLVDRQDSYCSGPFLTFPAELDGRLF
jgi:hypothetical protein